MDNDGVHEQAVIVLNETTLGFLRAEPDMWEAFQEAWERCQLAPDPKAPHVVKEAARAAAESRGFTRSQHAMLLAYLNAED